MEIRRCFSVSMSNDLVTILILLHDFRSICSHFSPEYNDESIKMQLTHTECLACHTYHFNCFNLSKIIEEVSVINRLLCNYIRTIIMRLLSYSVCTVCVCNHNRPSIWLEIWFHRSRLRVYYTITLVFRVKLLRIKKFTISIVARYYFLRPANTKLKSTLRDRPWSLNDRVEIAG